MLQRREGDLPGVDIDIQTIFMEIIKLLTL